MHNNRLQAIIEFRKAADQPVRTQPTVDIPEDEKALAISLIAEELNELIEALGASIDMETGGAVFDREPDLIAIADAYGDLQVVVEQLGPTFGLNGEAIFEEVHRSNMSKVDPATGKMPKKPNGKAGKGPLFTEPELAKVIAENPITVSDLDPQPDPNVDFIYAPSVQVARRIVPVDFPDLAQLNVITPTVRGIEGRRIRNVYALPGSLNAPGEQQQIKVIRNCQLKSPWEGRIIEL